MSNAASTKQNVASTLLLVWTGLNARVNARVTAVDVRSTPSTAVDSDRTCATAADGLKI